MVNRNIPPSLEELIALKRKSESDDAKKSQGKVKFLTKGQREKLETEKEESKPKIQEAAAVDHRRAETPIVEEEKPSNVWKSEKVNKRKTEGVSNGFKFDWDESEDTSQVDSLPVIGKRKTYDYSLDHPSRKRGKRDGAVDYDLVHWSEKPLDKMTERDWRILKEDYNISIRGNYNQQLIRNWHEAGIPKPIVENLQVLGYHHPTPIQRATVQLGLKGKDVIGIAETGSGKTLAFLIPAMAYIMNLPPVRPFESPYVLIVTPTRELAQQIETMCGKFMGKLHFNVASIVGGHSYEENINKLEKGVEILIGTPGRLLDILEKKLVDLSKCFYLIADEADRMMSMGFEKQVQSLFDELPPGDQNPFGSSDGELKRTTLMFTATMPKSVEQIISNYMTNPVTVTVGNVNNAVDRIVQSAIQVPNDDLKKLDILSNTLKKYQPPVIIFVNYQKSCDMIEQYLSNLGFRTATIHGNRTQRQREESIMQMKSGEADILIATDVAARGIDIPNVSLVVNYQMSKNISEYVHRIGRTGRAGKQGAAVTFWNPETDAEVLYDLKTMIQNSPVSKCPNDLLYNDMAKNTTYRNIEH